MVLDVHSLLYDSLKIKKKGGIKRQKLGTVTSVEYLGAIVSDEDSKPAEVLLSIEQATAALTKLKPIWRDNKCETGALPCLIHIPLRL